MTEENAAIVPEPEVPEKREYEVVGNHAVLGHEPGSSFTATLDFVQERRLIDGRAIRRKTATTTKRTTKSASKTTKRTRKSPSKSKEK